MVLLQVGGVTAVVGLTLLVTVFAAVYSAVAVVPADERHLLTVLGETRGVLEPGINFVPPFVSHVHQFAADERHLEFETEVRSADGMATAVRGSVAFTVSDPERAFAADAGHERALADDVRAVLREWVGERDQREVAADDRSMELALRDALEERATAYGVAVRSAEVDAVERTAG